MNYNPLQIGYEVEFLPIDTSIGDAIIVRFGNLLNPRDRKNQRVVVVDGGRQGTGDKIVQHIRRHYPDNVVDLAISTHPDADHSTGLAVVLNQMDVRELWLHPSQYIQESLSDVVRLETIAAHRGIRTKPPFADLFYETDFGNIAVLGPTEDYYRSLRRRFKKSGLGKSLGLVEPIYEQSEPGPLQEPTADVGAENNSSVILLFEVDERMLLLTADAGVPALERAANFAKLEYQIDLSECDFEQVPHHGSARNVGPAILNRIVGHIGSTRRKTAFISAPITSKHHPSSKVVDAYIERGAKVCATQGKTIRHKHNAPAREGWSAIQPLQHSAPRRNR